MGSSEVFLPSVKNMTPCPGWNSPLTPPPIGRGLHTPPWLECNATPRVESKCMHVHFYSRALFFVIERKCALLTSFMHIIFLATADISVYTGTLPRTCLSRACALLCLCPSLRVDFVLTGLTMADN